MMITIKVGNNVERKTVIADSAATLKSVIEANGFDPSRSYTLDGTTVSVERTFDELGAKDGCWLLAITKADNA